MGHTAVTVLMAVLSYCVRENVEVRTSQSDYDGALLFVFFGLLNVSVSVFVHVDVVLYIADTHPYLGQV